MTRYGIGPKFFIITMLTGVIAGWLTYLFPDLFRLSFIPFWIFAATGAVLLVTGFLVYAVSLKFFIRGFSKGHLVVEGPYSVVRHPIYASWIFLIFPGIALFFQSWLMLSVPAAAYLSFKAFIRKEDRDLEKSFAAAYLDYRSKVNELLPGRRYEQNK